IAEQTKDRERAELQDSANRAMIRLAEKLTPGTSSKINEFALRKFALSIRRERKSWKVIKEKASSRFPELKDLPGDEATDMWARIQNADRQTRFRGKRDK